MATTYTLIASNTLGSATSSVTFSSIPTTYTDLVLRSSVRHDGTGGNIWFMGVQFNSLTSNIYSDTFLVTDFTSTIGTRNSNETPFGIHAGTINQNNYTASTFSNTEIYIPSYQANGFKAWGSELVNENNATNYNYLGFCAGLVRSADAITSMTLRPNGSVGNFASGSSFFLYGISNS